jgi:lipoprotein-anchoring transpeptidase ErfK/SrfK
MLGLATVALALTATTACSQGASAHWRAAGSSEAINSAQAGGGAPSPSKVPGEIKLNVTGDPAKVPVLDPVEVAAVDATLESVNVVNPDGKQVSGEFAADRKTWHTTEPFGYGKEYTVTAVGANTAGQRIEHTSKFSTLKPAEQTMPYLRASDAHLLKERSTYGVGQTIQIFFDEKVDKATVQKLLKVTAEPAVEGSWYWHSAQKVEWRTEKYLTPGTKVSVSAKLYGKDLGNGTYAQADIGGQFTVGPSKIAVVDTGTKQMQVFEGGQMVRQFPISAGRGGEKKLPDGSTINYWTPSGPMVVLDKAPETKMSSASYGVKDKKDPDYYEEDIKFTTRLTNDGIYTHLADWHRMHGIANISHGCVNMPPGHAQWFYNEFDRGDVVEVKGSPIRESLTNGNGAWTISWADWQKGSAL